MCDGRKSLEITFSDGTRVARSSSVSPGSLSTMVEITCGNGAAAPYQELPIAALIASLAVTLESLANPLKGLEEIESPRPAPAGDRRVPRISRSQPVEQGSFDRTAIRAMPAGTS